MIAGILTALGCLAVGALTTWLGFMLARRHQSETLTSTAIPTAAVPPDVDARISAMAQDWSAAQGNPYAEVVVRPWLSAFVRTGLIEPTRWPRYSHRKNT